MAKKYDFKKIEKKWQAAWKREGTYEPALRGKGRRKPFYNLMMFPYPSAEGLHAGNMYAFTGSDIYGRFKRMQGFDVFEPIGLDGFGIHSENYAMKVGVHPAKQAKISEKRFYKQLDMIGNSFAWKEHLETYDPEYYRWTQWIFLQMWHAGLAYRKKQAVNWCPSCQTVLADEQVISGKCERCNSVVEKRELEQWFFRITKYAEKLLSNLDKIDWSDKVRIAQRNWIGKSEGAEITFKLEAAYGGEAGSVTVFTTRPDTIFGATYLVLAPEHPLLAELLPHAPNRKEAEAYIRASRNKPEEERIADDKEKTGVELKGLHAVNPANGHKMPVWVADYVLGGYGTGAIMAVPAHDARDNAFAKKFLLPITRVIQPAPQGDAAAENDLWTGGGVLINSGKFNGLPVAGAKRSLGREFGAPKVQYRLRDWLISRQRYWGPPIPMIFCPACAEAHRGEQKGMPGWYAEKEKNLPVRLPVVKDFRPKGTGQSPLATVRSFYETKCPKCRGKARREVDVSDTFLDSAWYYLRYPNVREKARPWNAAVNKKWLPVNMYIGGAEHSVLHLLYSRFVTMVLRDLKHISFEEPFTRFRAHGLIIKDGAKMSKSKGNVVNPDAYVQRFSADVLRTYLMFLAPFEQGGDFRDEGMLGAERFLVGARKYFELRSSKSAKTELTPKSLKKALHKTIKKVTEDIENLKYNTAISQMMILFNELSAAAANDEYLGAKDAEAALKLMAPFAPHMTEELWRGMFRHKGSIHLEAWPKYDPKMVVDDTFSLIVQVNGKLRASITAPAGLTEEAAKDLAMKEPRVREAMANRNPRRIIYVPGRLLNIVV